MHVLQPDGGLGLFQNSYLMEIGLSSNGMTAWNKEGQRGPKDEARRLGNGCDCRGNALRVGAAWKSGSGGRAGDCRLRRQPHRGIGLPNSDSLPSQLEKALKARGQDVKVINAGVSGDTAGGGDLPGSTGRCHDASAVIIELGANDALQGLDPAATKAVLEKIITDVKGRGFPSCSPAWKRRAISARSMWSSSARFMRTLPTDTTSSSYPFFLDGVALDDKYLLGDGLHPNAEGVARIVELILPKVEELLAKTKARP